MERLAKGVIQATEELVEQLTLPDQVLPEVVGPDLAIVAGISDGEVVIVSGLVVKPNQVEPVAPVEQERAGELFLGEAR